MGTPEESKTDTQPEMDWKAEFEKAEKRRKDTQAAFTKSQQALKAREAELQVLKTTGPAITPTVARELEDLKFKDPDAWKNRLDELTNNHNATIAAKTKELTDQVVHQSELERRASVMAEFNVANPGLVITDEVIQYDVPPRITKKLIEGTVSFEDFLVEVKEYLNTPKKVKADGVEQQPNLSKVGGGSTPTVDSGKVATSYEKEIF